MTIGAKSKMNDQSPRNEAAVLDSREVAFLARYHQEQTTRPFGGRATKMLLDVGIQAHRAIPLLWAFESHADRSDIQPSLTCPWSTREAVLATIVRINESRIVTRNLPICRVPLS
jgi:hypothetical protein